MLTPAQAMDQLLALPEGPFVLERVRQTPGAWIVGGAVRDVLLGRAPRELDVVVEADPAPLIAALGGSAVSHARFGTATVTLDVPGAPGPVTVDIARARTEAYAEPGALPDVQEATVLADLQRRDVSVNAIALRPGAEGAAPELLHVPGALDDLDRGVLRVLHDRSFRDDPTRVWRVARYAARLGFAVDEHTAALAAQADPGTVTGVRLGNELRLALRERDPLAALSATAALNGRLLPKGIDLAPRRLAAALALLPAGGRADLVTLAACCGPVDAATLVGWLADLGFSAAELDIVAAGSRASTYMPLHQARSGSAIARAARGVPLEVVALAGGAQAERWIRELQHVRLQITGQDLLAAGVPEGPIVGRVLQRVLDQRLDGTLAAGREAELAAARAALAAAEDD
ncbi:MAG: tRNA nucleotidyltransferase [Solirubrobacterales bacterium]|nr:tRNA nucleotidyltransferase [Solirubrobacterales bacterium]